MIFRIHIDILHDSSISLVIELIGGIDDAFTILKESIQNGKHVVTYPILHSYLNPSF